MIRIIRILVLYLPLFLLAGCSVNPATGEQSFTAFMSRADEMEIGQREHPKILKLHGGAYRDPDLAAYVRDVGTVLARVSEVPDLPYVFTVVNDDQVNAFAVPGGSIYVTRGLLALAENEAEMAAVLAHELGHITARHAAQRYSQAVAANLGLTLLGVLGSAAGMPVGVGDLASLGTQLYLQSYSREQELEADVLAVRYMTRAGYDANAVIGFFHRMEAHKRLQASLAGDPAAGERFNILSTHPRTADRIRQAMGLARAAPLANPRLGRDAYLARIDGMIFGDDPEQGVRRGREFIHPGLGFRFQVPAGFVMVNRPQHVIARGPGGAAIVFDMIQGKKAAQAGNLVGYLIDDWGRRLALREVERIDVNGMDAATGHASLQARQGPVDVRLVAIREGPRRLYRFNFQTPRRLTQSLAPGLQRTTYSLRRLSADEAAAIRPLRLRVVEVKPGDTAHSLAATMPFETGWLEWFEVLNGLRRGQPLAAGRRVKLVVD